VTTYTLTDASTVCKFVLNITPCALRCKLGTDLKLPASAGACTAKLTSAQMTTQLLDPTSLAPTGTKVTWTPASPWPVGARQLKATVTTGKSSVAEVWCGIEVADAQSPVIKSKVAAKSAALATYCGFPLVSATKATTTKACWAPADLATFTDNCAALGLAYNYTCAVTDQGVQGDCGVVYAQGGAAVERVCLAYPSAGAGGALVSRAAELTLKATDAAGNVASLKVKLVSHSTKVSGCKAR